MLCAHFRMKRLLSIFISLVLLGILYWKIDFSKLLPVLAGSDPLWMVVSLAMVVPLTLATAWRLQQLMPRAGLLGFGEANRLILVASVLNLVLPSKMGDIAKAWFMRDRGQLPGSLALSLVVFEKACDMLSLLLWCVFGLAWVKLSGAVALDAFSLGGWLPGARGEAIFWLAFASVAGSLGLGLLLLGSKGFASFFFALAGKIAPGKIGTKFASLADAWAEMHAYFWGSKARLAKVALTSIGIWFLHLLQVWLFILALRAACPFFANLALSPLAILAGLLPLTFAGVGTRDAALVIFYAPYFAAPTGAALGLLCTARYILPAIGGLPFAGPYLTAAKSMRKSALAATAPGA
jgi:hypothetical protein